MQGVAGAVDWISDAPYYVVGFLFALTILVFVHEFGHYIVARWCRVRVEVFSIGFGPELFGWNDRAGTRWRISAVPLGGYVKMFGDSDPASSPDPRLSSMSAEQRAVSFHHKGLKQRAAIVVAGPLANFLFAIVVLAIVYAVVGQPYSRPEIESIQPASAAEQGGLKPGDIVRSIDGAAINRFEDIQRIVQASPEIPLLIVVDRGGAEFELIITPGVTELIDRIGNRARIGLLGVRNSRLAIVRHDPLAAVWHATRETWGLSIATLHYVGQMIVGARPADEIGGPLRIAQMAGEVSRRHDPVSMSWFLVVLSINLGLINLFPIPMLDGGHLVFYAAEALRGRPLGARVQEYAAYLGLSLVLALMVFATWNDLVHLRVVALIGSLLT